MIARELGLLANWLYACRKRFPTADAGAKTVAEVSTGTPADLQAQLDAPRSEIARITEQRDI